MDYIHKPFQKEELLARVFAHTLDWVCLNKALITANEKIGAHGYCGGDLKNPIAADIRGLSGF